MQLLFPHFLMDVYEFIRKGFNIFCPFLGLLKGLMGETDIKGESGVVTKHSKKWGSTCNLVVSIILFKHNCNLI